MKAENATSFGDGHLCDSGGGSDCTTLMAASMTALTEGLAGRSCSSHSLFTLETRGNCPFMNASRRQHVSVSSTSFTQ